MIPTNSVTLSFPARLENLDLVEACLTTLLGRETHLADPAGTTFEAVLAVHEAVTNIMAHAYGGRPDPISVCFSLLDDPRRLVVDLRDSGQAFDLPSIQPPNENGVQTSGYGLFLIHRLMDEVQYSPETGNNRWLLVKILA